MDLWTLRSEILTFFSAGFSLLVVRKSGLFFCSFSSPLPFGWQKRAVLHFVSTSDSINPLLCVRFLCPTMTPCGELAGGDGLGWDGVR